MVGTIQTNRIARLGEEEDRSLDHLPRPAKRDTHNETAAGGFLPAAVDVFEKSFIKQTSRLPASYHRQTSKYRGAFRG